MNNEKFFEIYIFCVEIFFWNRCFMKSELEVEVWYESIGFCNNRVLLKIGFIKVKEKKVLNVIIINFFFWMICNVWNIFLLYVL